MLSQTPSLSLTVSLRQSRLFAPVLILIILWTLLTIQLNAPWFGHHDANGVWLSAVSRNFRTYGMASIGPIPVLNRGPIPPETIERYVDHPPLVPWLVTLAQVIFGDHEMSARIVSIFSTMIAVSAFFVLCRRLYNRSRALLTLVFYAFTPMIFFFGRMPDHEPLSLAFLLIFLAVFVNWSRQPTRQRWWLMILMAVLGIWSAWAIFFFVALIGLFGWWKCAPAQRSKMVILVGIGVASVISVAAFYQLVDSNTLTWLVRAFLWRTSTVSEISQDFTVFEFIGQTLVHLVAFGTIGVLVCGLIGTIPSIQRARGMDQAILLTLALAGIVYIFVFRSASYVHDYYKIYMMPFLGIASANAVTLAWKQPRIQRFARPALVGLFLVSMSFALLYISGQYTISYAGETLDFAKTVADHTAPQEVVLSNFPDSNPVVEYYANRDILWNISPEEAATRVQSDSSSVYVYCGTDSSTVYQLLTGKTPVESADCQFIRFGSK